MNKIDFLNEAKRIIITDMVKTTNTIMGLNKTAALSTGLFLKLPIVFRAEQTDLVQYNKHLALQDLIQLSACHTEPGDTTKVIFTFLYENDKHLKQILKCIVKNLFYFSYQYTKQLQHVVRKHKTQEYALSMAKLTKKKQDSYTLTNMANDFAIHSAFEDLFKNSKFFLVWNELKKLVLFSNKFYSDRLTETQIMKELVEIAPKIQLTKFSKTIQIFIYNKLQIFIPKEEYDNSSAQVSNLGDSIYNTIIQSTWGKGSHAGVMFKEAFDSIKVDTKWFDKLQGSFLREVHEKTENFYQSWRNINPTYRHVYNSPISVNEEVKLNIILSVDNSGSVPTEDLQKLFGLLKDVSKKIAKCIVLIHTTDIASEYTLEDEYDIANSSDFAQAFAVRTASGGTSHRQIRKYIEDMDIQNPEEYIYISSSDNYSDIETEFIKSPIMRKLTKYFLSTSGGRTVDTDIVGGTNIVMP